MWAWQVGQRLWALGRLDPVARLLASHHCTCTKRWEGTRARLRIDWWIPCLNNENLLLQSPSCLINHIHNRTEREMVSTPYMNKEAKTKRGVVRRHTNVSQHCPVSYWKSSLSIKQSSVVSKDRVLTDPPHSGPQVLFRLWSWRDLSGAWSFLRLDTQTADLILRFSSCLSWYMKPASLPGCRNVLPAFGVAWADLQFLRIEVKSWQKESNGKQGLCLSCWISTIVLCVREGGK